MMKIMIQLFENKLWKYIEQKFYNYFETQQFSTDFLSFSASCHALLPLLSKKLQDTYPATSLRD